MAKKLVYKYTFTPGGAGAGTIVVNGNWKERSLLLITNVLIILSFTTLPKVVWVDLHHIAQQQIKQL